jgi:hypothetical protein
VQNAADYLCELVRRPRRDLQDHGTFHHLAEFWDKPWRAIIEDMGAAMGVEPVFLAGYVPRRRRGPLRSVVAVLRHVDRSPLGGRARQFLMRFGKLPGLDAAFDRVLQWQVAVAPLESPRPADHERVLFDILSEPIGFRPHVLPGWTFPVAWSDALASVRAWLHDAGFTVAASPSNRSDERR